MRRLIVAIVSTLLAVLGCVAVAGTAQAADNDGYSVSIGGVRVNVCSQNSVDSIVSYVNSRNGAGADITATDVLAAFGGLGITDYKAAHCSRTGNGNGHGWPGGPVGGPWNDQWDGHRWLTLDRGPRLDLCSYATYGDLIGRNGVYRDRIGRYLTADRFAGYRRSCGVGAGTVVSDNGDCVTYTTARDSLRNYSTDYVRLRNLYHGDFRRMTVGERSNLNRLWGLSNRYRNDWNSRLVNLRTVCKDDTPPVTIINEAPDQVVTAPAPATVTEQAPAPVIINQPNLKIPNTSAGMNNGDGSFPIARS